MEKLKELHFFWFDEIEITDEYYEKKVPQWFFGKDPAFDMACKDRFSSLLKNTEEMIGVAPSLSSRDYLSFVILLDQIPRNSYRGTQEAFAFDSLALKLCLDSFEAKREKDLSFPEKLFLYLPLEHSEDLLMQKLSVEKYYQLHLESPMEIKKWTELALKKAKEHKETIETHGRFPSRDLALNRH